MAGEQDNGQAPQIYHSNNFLMVDKDVLCLLNGDWKAACFLAKVLDLQQQSDDDGWVYHSWPQWEDDYFSRAEVERCVALLAPFGLEVEVRQHVGRLTRHYRVQTATLTAAITTLRESYRVPVEKSHPVTSFHPVGKLQGPCEKVTGDPVEKSQCLQGSDLITRSKKTDLAFGANAPSDAAKADADVPAVAPKKKSTRTKNTSADPAWDAMRQAGFELLTELHGRDGFNHGMEASTLERLYRIYRIRSPDELRAVWQATLIDPWWETTKLSMTDIEKKIGPYRHSPDNFQAGMQKKRDQANRTKKGPSNAQPDITFDPKDYSLEGSAAIFHKPIR